MRIRHYPCPGWISSTWVFCGIVGIRECLSMNPPWPDGQAGLLRMGGRLVDHSCSYTGLRQILTLGKQLAWLIA